MGDFELFYIRDKMKREVDFCVTKDGYPWLLLEVKSSEKALSPALVHYSELLRPEFSIQLLPEGAPRREQYSSQGARIQMIAIDEFLSALN